MKYQSNVPSKQTWIARQITNRKSVFFFFFPWCTDPLTSNVILSSCNVS